MLLPHILSIFTVSNYLSCLYLQKVLISTIIYIHIKVHLLSFRPSIQLHIFVPNYPCAPPLIDTPYPRAIGPYFRQKVGKIIELALRVIVQYNFPAKEVYPSRKICIPRILANHFD